MSAQRVMIRVATMELVDGKSKPDEGGGGSGEHVEHEDADEADMEQEQAESGDAAKEASSAPAGGEKRDSSTLTVSPTIHQTVHVCAEHKKFRKLAKYLTKVRETEKASGARQRAAILIFCTQIKTLRAVDKFVHKNGERCAPLHSGIPQVKREQALADLKSGRIDTLVATDVASRGLHVARLKHVINYDFPTNLELYCHRIGRVGRQGVEGWSCSFFTRNLVPLAPGLITILERAGQAVDPNLRELAEGKAPSAENHAEDSDASGGDGPPAEPAKRKRQRPDKKGAAATAETAGDAPKGFRPGASVLIRGLRAAAELNGQAAQLRSKDGATGRWEVVLKSGAVKAVKEGNLELKEDGNGVRDAYDSGSHSEGEAGPLIGRGGGLCIRPAKRRKRASEGDDSSSSSDSGGDEKQEEADDTVSAGIEKKGTAGETATTISKRQKERKRQKQKQLKRRG